jgi:hypothetical protein
VWTTSPKHDVYSMLAFALPKPERSNRSSGLIRNSYLLCSGQRELCELRAWRVFDVKLTAKPRLPPLILAGVPTKGLMWITWSILPCPGHCNWWTPSLKVNYLLVIFSGRQSGRTKAYFSHSLIRSVSNVNHTLPSISIGYEAMLLTACSWSSVPAMQLLTTCHE